MKVASWLLRLAEWVSPLPGAAMMVDFEVLNRPGATVQQTPLSEIRVVHSTIGTQANRSQHRNERNAWKNRR